MYGDKILSIIQIDFVIRAVKDQKKAKMTKMAADVVVAVAAALPSTQLLSRTLWLCPSRQDSYHRPRASFSGGVKKEALAAHHYETLNGDEGAKTIRQPYYLPNTATADLFLFQRGKVEAGRPLAVPGRSHE